MLTKKLKFNGQVVKRSINVSKGVRMDNNDKSEPMVVQPTTSPEPSTDMQQPSVTANAPKEPVANTTPAFNPAVPPLPTPPTQVAVGGDMTSTPSPSTGSVVSSPKRSGKKRKLLLPLVAAAVLLLGGSAGAYFGIVVPNKPENVWETAMSNTAKGYDKLVSYTESQQDKTSFKSDLDFKVEAEGVVVDGSGFMESDSEDMKADIDINAFGEKIGLEMAGNIPSEGSGQTVYVKLSNLPALLDKLGATEFVPIADMINDKWYVIDESTMSSLGLPIETDTEAEVAYSPEDAAELMNAIGSVSKEYLFTTDESKAAFRVAEFVGKETVEGRGMYHYKVSANKENLKTFVTRLEEELKKTAYAENLRAEGLSLDGLVKSVDDISDEDTVDVWVDSATKLIRTVRISDKDNDKNYVDFGLKYTGGDEFPFFVDYNGEVDGTAGTANMTYTLNTATDKSSLVIKVDTTGENAFSASATMNFELGNFDVTIDKPSDATPIADLMSQLLGGSMTIPMENL